MRAVQRLGWLGVGAITALLQSSCGTSIRAVPLAQTPETDSRIESLRRQVPASWSVVDASPFVVVSDVPRDEIQYLVTEVVTPASRALERYYFDVVPRRVVTIWWLNGEDSYRSNADAYLHQTPHTEYGYYAPRRHAVVMNHSLGAGTALHEMVHAYMRASFPDAPVWFDEGLASLYEQSSFERGVLRGQVNWRLGLLKIEIQEENVPPLREVLQASRRRFYTEEVRASHYAVARYVCYYLQERKLLVPYFTAFRASRDHDRYGIATLEETVGAQLEVFERDWTRFVRRLEFRRERRG